MPVPRSACLGRAVGRRRPVGRCTSLTGLGKGLRSYRLQRRVTEARIRPEEGRMGEASLYETDILAWTEQQAAALRDLAGRRDLPNALDLENVIEEIETLGRNELKA